MRRGWKTSEFWISAFVVLGIVLTSATSINVLPGKWAEIASAIAAGAYAISRGLAKKPA